MKYDVLNSFRKYLNENIQNKNTADRYYFAVENVFKDMTFKGGEEISRDNVEKILLAMKGKSNFSAAKNGLKHFASFDNSFDRPDDKFFNAIGLTKKNRSVKPNKTLNYDSINKKINAIDDKKLKEAYRLMMFSGLRVSEAAQLNKNDITFVDDETVKINVLHGKGGANGEVLSVKNKGFVQGLKQYLENCPDDKPFYAAKTMKNKAGKIDLECHDFRRIASQLHKNEALEEGCNAFDANDSTKEFLRHKRFSTTKRYLMNRKLEVSLPKEAPTDISLATPKTQHIPINHLSNNELLTYTNITKNEPIITSVVEKITLASGGHLVGLEFRLKTPESVYEKLHDRDETTPIDHMNDIIRYTSIYSSSNLAASTVNNLSQFENNNIAVVKIKNTWLNKDSAYKGINVILKHLETGQAFEMQYHTQESFDLKNNEMHRLYEKSRVLSTGSQERQKLDTEMIVLSKSLQLPHNIGVVKEKK